MVNVPQDGVRTFLPPQLCSGGFTPPLHPPKPAITRPARQLSLYTVRSLKILLLQPSARPRIQRMRVREAKDFLVRQIQEQAALEGESLSELESRMLYFTEQGGLTEEMRQINEEFDANYDSAKYEKKISRLMGHAYKRLCKESESSRRTWDAAIRRLKRGDHYVLVMWDMRPGLHASSLIGVGIGAFVLAGYFGVIWITRHVAPPNPHLMLGIFTAFVLASFLFRRAMGDAFGWLLEKTLFRFLESKEEGEDS